VQVFVDCLLLVHKKYTEMVRKAFDNDATFVAAMDRACKAFVNKNAVTEATKSTTKSPELLAKYCHGLLKKGSKIAEGQDVEMLLEGVMLVFQYLEDNDVFQVWPARSLPCFATLRRHSRSACSAWL
jgi:cullin 1